MLRGRDAECRMQNAKCKMQNAKCKPLTQGEVAPKVTERAGRGWRSEAKPVGAGVAKRNR